jgi:MFS family permease
LPAIIEGLHISPSRAGFALTLMMGLYAVSQYPGGRLSDDLSRTTVLVVGIGAMIVGFSILIVAGGYPGFLVGVAFVGMGAGSFFSPARAFLSDLYVERRGQVFGLHTAAGMIGGVLAATSAAMVIALETWRAAFVVPTILLVCVLVLLHHWSHEPYVISRVSLELRGTVRRLFTSKRVQWLVLGYALFGFTLQAFIGFLPTLLQAEKGFSPGLASGGFALIYVVGIAVGPAAGRLSDRVPRGQVAVGSLIFAGSGLIVLLSTSSLLGIYGAIAATSVGIWAYVPTIQAYMMDMFSKESLGGDFGLLKAVYTGLGSLGPTYVGMVAERSNYIVAFSGLVLCLFAAAAVIWFATRLK